MAEVLDFSAATRGTALRPPRRPVRPRMPGAPGGMPVIAPMPAARPTRIPSQRDGSEAESAAAAGTTVDHLTETYRAHYRDGGRTLEALGLAESPH
ncbi:hypothetical protein ACWEGM_34580, partial [Streptomyces nigra]